MLIVESLLLLLVSFGAPMIAQEDEPPPAVETDPASILVRKQAYLDLLSKYFNANGSYSFEVKALRKQGIPPEQYPESPLKQYFVLFRDLAEEGNGDAMFWVIENMNGILKEPKERERLAKRYFTALSKNHAGEEFIPKAIDLLISRRKFLGSEFTTSALHTIGENCGSVETEAAAILGEARVLFNYGKAASDEDRAMGNDLMQILVDGYAGTKAAKSAAEHVYRREVKQTLEVQTEWVAQARELQASGVGPDGWPPHPVEAFHAQFQSLAATGHLLSNRWLEGFYPGYKASMTEGLDKTLLFICDYISQVELTRNVYWQGLRFEIVKLLVETWPDEPWIHKLVVDMGNAVQYYTPDVYVPVLRRFIDLVPSDRTRYEAMLTMAQSLERGATYAELEEALEIYQCIIDESPIERHGKEAEIARRAFALTMPGAPMPPFIGRDNDGLDLQSTAYAGKVLVLFFWSFNNRESKEEVPWINELHEKYQGTDLRVLGMNLDTTTRRLFNKFAREAGVTWRNALMQSKTGLVGVQFGVTYVPTVFIIDSQGTIRGRALDHQRAEALIDQLLAEKE